MDLDRPAPYRVADHKEWIVCDEPGMEGFAIYVRTSITNVEQREFRKANDYIEGEYTDAWFARPPEERDMADSPRVRQRKVLAPYIHDWNAEALTANGEWARVPPPAVAGYEAFDCILATEMGWILDVVLGGYRALGKAVSLRKVSEAIGTLSDDKPPESDRPQPEPTPARKRRKS